MKTENEFNSEMGKALRRFSPGVHVLKISDKFTTGISDFIIFCNGRALCLETKFEKSFPQRDSSLVLSHPFSGAQVTFLESIELTKNMGFGMVAIEETRTMYVFKYETIPASGNFTKEEFLKSAVTTFTFGDFTGLINFFFNWHP